MAIIESPLPAKAAPSSAQQAVPPSRDGFVRTGNWPQEPLIRWPQPAARRPPTRPWPLHQEPYRGPFLSASRLQIGMAWNRSSFTAAALTSQTDPPFSTFAEPETTTG